MRLTAEREDGHFVSIKSYILEMVQLSFSCWRCNGLEIVLDLISPNCFLKNFVCSSTKFEGKTFLFSCAACFYRFYFYFSPSCSRLTKNLVIILNVVTIILSGSISFFWKYNYILCQEWFILWWGSHPTHECKINSYNIK